MTDLVFVLKALSLLLTGIFAVIGMRAEHGGLKKLFRSVAFWGVAITTTLSVCLLFVETRKEVKEAVETSVRLAKTAEQQEQLLNNITGGDSYCYLLGGAIDEDVIALTLFNKGRFPLYDVWIEAADRDVLDQIEIRKLEGASLWDFARANTTSFQIGTISPKLGRHVTTFSLKGLNRKRLNFNIYSRYRTFNQHINFLKINGEWEAAYRVVESVTEIKDGIVPPEKVLVDEKSQHYPVDEHGKIKW